MKYIFKLNYRTVFCDVNITTTENGKYESVPGKQYRLNKILAMIIFPLIELRDKSDNISRNEDSSGE